MKKQLMFIFFIFLNSILLSAPTKPLNILVYTRTNAYYHEVTPNAIKALYEISRENKWIITFTEDSTFFRDEILNTVDVVVFLLNGGDLFSEAQKESFQKFIRRGGGFVGIHSATVVEYKWPWYGQLVGAYFTGHPPVHEGKLIIENKNHISTRHFGVDTLNWKDEWYSFDRNPRANVEVLMSLDEKSYNIEENLWFPGVNLVMGDHPLVWCHIFNGGRSFQTALGHIPEMYDNIAFRKHLTGGILWAGGIDN